MQSDYYMQGLSQLPQTHYLDNRIYTDPDIFAQERNRIFETVWNFVCLASEAPQPGDFRTVSVAGHSVLVFRAADQTLRAVYNTCTRRRTPLVHQARGAGFDPTNFGLADVRLETLGGLVFVCLSQETEALADYLGPALVEQIQTTLGQVELEAVHYHQAELQTNWKLWNDNNSEIYHNFLHVFNRKTTPEAMYSHTGHVLYANGHAFMMTTDPRARVQYTEGGIESRASIRTFPGLHGNATWIANIFPDLLLLVRGTIMRIDRMVPLSPGRTRVEWRGVGMKDDTPEVRAMRLRHHNQIWGPMGRNLPEDVLAVEEQWQLMNSGSVVGYSVYAREHERLADGRFQALDDENMRAFYQAWGQCLGRSPQAPFGEVARQSTSQAGVSA